MKKFLALLLMLCLCASLCISFTACGEPEEDGTTEQPETEVPPTDDTPSARSTVTEEEWNNALGMSNFTNFMFEGSSDTVLRDTEGNVLYEDTETYPFLKTDGICGYETNLIDPGSSNWVGFYSDMNEFSSDINELIEKLAEFNYIFEGTFSLFTYDDSKKAYVSNTFDFHQLGTGLPTTTTITFSDGKLTSVIADTYHEADGKIGNMHTELNFTYNVTIDATDKNMIKDLYRTDFVDTRLPSFIFTDVYGEIIEGETIAEKKANVITFIEKLLDFELVELAGYLGFDVRIFSVKDVSFEFNNKQFSSELIEIKSDTTIQDTYYSYAVYSSEELLFAFTVL